LISNIYLLAQYNRYVNGLKECYKYRDGLTAKQVTGNMVLLKNDAPTDYTLALLSGEVLVPGQTEFVVPEEVMEIDQNIQQNCSLKAKFIVTPQEFRALREDIRLCS